MGRLCSQLLAAQHQMPTVSLAIYKLAGCVVVTNLLKVIFLHGDVQLAMPSPRDTDVLHTLL